MRLLAKCPGCDVCGEAPEHFFGSRVRCVKCRCRFLLGPRELVMTLMKCEGDAVLDFDSIEVFACPRCSVLGYLINHRKHAYFRCPDCQCLCSLDDEAGWGRGLV